MQHQDQTLTKEIEQVTSVVLREPSLPVAFDEGSPKVLEVIDEINPWDATSIISFGSSAQSELQQISQAMLSDVRNKDVGPAGDSLREMVTTIRGFAVSELDMRREKSWFERLLGKAAPLANFMARYEGVQNQIDVITDNLLRHEHQLLKDIKSLDLLYEKTLTFFDEVGIYIEAGERKVLWIEQEVIEGLEAQLQSSSEEDKIKVAQELRDAKSARDDLERRVHDLKLTRQVTMQSLPSIRLVQENDKALVAKINSTLTNTVPLWEMQLAQAITIQNSSEAAKSIGAANDLTNELLTSNAANLRESNTMIRQEMERGIFDIEAVKKANADLIGTIQESLQIADEGKRKRAEAESELKKMEVELRDTLAAAKAKQAA